MPEVVPRVEARQYDGTGGDALAAWFTNTELVSEENGVLVLRIDQGAGAWYEPQIRTGDWLIRSSAGWFEGTTTPEDYALRWRELPTA